MALTKKEGYDANEVISPADRYYWHLSSSTFAHTTFLLPAHCEEICIPDNTA